MFSGASAGQTENEFELGNKCLKFDIGDGEGPGGGPT